MKIARIRRTVRTQDIGLSVVLAIQGSIMFVMSPLSATGLVPPPVVEVFRFGLAVVAALLLTRNRLVASTIGATLLISLLLSFVVKPSGADNALALFRLAITTAFDLAVAIAVANVAFGEGRVTVPRILGAVILYLSIALIFTNAYRACALTLHPSLSGVPTSGRGSFSTILYFSLTTLTTTGYGDILPVHPFVRSLANLEALIGQLYPATLLARLVTLHAAAKTPRELRD